MADEIPMAGGSRTRLGVARDGSWRTGCSYADLQSGLPA
jgi:hypothetical protein